MSSEKTVLAMLMALLVACSGGMAGQPSSTSHSDDAMMEEKSDEMYNHLTTDNAIREIVDHPAFEGFGDFMLPRDHNSGYYNTRLSSVGSLMPYHSHVEPEIVVGAINHMIDEINDGKTIFYDFYTEQEKQEDSTKESTGLFFFRGKPGVPFAIVCPGGGFSYVGSLHEGFPLAQRISELGLNAFVIRYRIGSERYATADLAAALAYVFRNAETLGVDTSDYALWGGSAGARMVGNIALDGRAIAYGKNRVDFSVWENSPKEEKKVKKHPVEKLKDHFVDVEDPRSDNASHLLIDIITIAICALICGADGWVEIETYGNAKLWWFQHFLELPHGIPSHDTFGRVFAVIDPQQFRESFLSCVKAIAELMEEHIAIDGKKLRRSHDRTNDKAALHMVSAWSSKNGLVIGQEKVRDKSNEIIAIPALLELLDLANCIITIDAMGCQTKIAQKIVDSDAEYVLALKKNQGNLYEIVEVFFSDPAEIKAANCDYHKEVSKGHGRIEIRECWATDDKEYLKYIEQELGHWEGLQSLIMVKSERRISGDSSAETRYFISSLSPDAKHLLHTIRSHWGIENKLHWVLDMAFREDESRVRQGNATENLAIMRHLCLNLLKKEKTAKCGIKVKRLKAGWDMSYLFKVLSA